MGNAIDDFEIPEVEKRALEDELNEFTKSKNEDNNEERRLVLSAQQAIEQPEVGQIIESVAKMDWTEVNGNTYVGTGFLAKINLGEEDRLGFFTAGHNLVDEGTNQVVKANSVKLSFRHIRKYTIKVNLSKLLRHKHILIVAHKKTIIIVKDGQTSIQTCREGIDFGVVLFTSAVDSAGRFLHKLGLSYLQVARPGACGSFPNMPVQLVGFPQYVDNSPMRILPGIELAVPEGSIPDHSYTLETQPGASGGSVFDKGGRVIAVHVKGQNLKKGDQGNWGLGFDIIRNELLQCLGGSGMALELQSRASDLNINQGMLELTSFLRRLKLEKYIPIFEEEDIDFEVLEICEPGELEELLGKIGISLGHIKKIRKAMQEEKRDGSGASHVTDREVRLAEKCQETLRQTMHADPTMVYEEELIASLTGVPPHISHAQALPQKVICVVGGSTSMYMEGALNTMTHYNPSLSRRYSIKEPMKTPRHGIAVAALHNNLYAIGGLDPSNKALNSVELFNPTTRSWQYTPNMNGERIGAGALAINNNIFVCGGSVLDWLSGVKELDTVEVFNASSSIWSRLPNMNKCRHNPAVVELHGRVYVLGGLKEKSVEMFNTMSQEWELSVPMMSVRSGLGAATIGGKIYAVGGIDRNGSILRSGEVYDPQLRRWTRIADMTEARYGVAVVALNEQLWAICGHDGGKALSSAEVYDKATDSWENVGEISTARCFSGAAILSF